MSTNRGVDIGAASESFNGWTTTEVRFNRFADLPATRNEGVYSPGFSCFGNRWKLRLYPGGKANSQEGYVASSLLNQSNASIKIQWGFSVRDAEGKEVANYEPQTNEFAEVSCQDLARHSGWCAHDFSERSTLMESLVDGSLVIEVRMKPTSTDKTNNSVHTNKSI